MPETTVFTPSQSEKPFSPTVKDVETVKALNRYFLLTAEQVRRLFYGAGSISYAKERMRLLAKHGYADRLDNSAVKEFAYRLGPKGLKLLRELDEETPRRLRKYLSSDSEYYVPHTIAINDVLISADLLNRTQPDMRVNDLIHEKRMSAIQVPIGGGETEGVITDGIITFSKGPYYVTFFLEVDMGSYIRKRWMQKIRKLIAYGSGPYKRHMDSEYFTVLVITPRGEEHMQLLRKWTADVLREDNLIRKWQHNFLFTAVPASTTRPDDFWFGQGWYEAIAQAPISLMGGGQ